MCVLAIDFLWQAILICVLAIDSLWQAILIYVLAIDSLAGHCYLCIRYRLSGRPFSSVYDQPYTLCMFCFKCYDAHRCHTKLKEYQLKLQFSYGCRSSLCFCGLQHQNIHSKAFILYTWQ